MLGADRGLEGNCPNGAQGGRLRVCRGRNALEASLLGLFRRLPCRCTRCGWRSYLRRSGLTARRPVPEQPPLADNQVLGFQELVTGLQEAETLAEVTRPRPKVSAWMGADQY